ncbi:glycine cleavage system protein GcvH [Paenibacillus agricola]|uniref:Glycine cleavage system H protein n=1 Tax=Paenibacillus agricola TaxID=2716264 RepID=A0ABX0JCF5_9BACL|nr:glycine cleavage system protein GcvH [Paenibacillus agricola]NHN33456.1 glycine cleavage system protein GcvH [Paenibacillus agricola]
MSEVKDQLFYSKEHEWVEVINENTIRIGITDFAQSQLGDIVFVELPEIGAEVQAEASLGNIESVKTVSDLFAPVTGVVAKVNSTLLDQPEIVNSDAFGEGWMIELEIDASAHEALKQLLTAEQYREYTAE